MDTEKLHGSNYLYKLIFGIVGLLCGIYSMVDPDPLSMRYMASCGTHNRSTESVAQPKILPTGK